MSARGELRKLVKDAQRASVQIEKTKHGIRFIPEIGGMVAVSSTPGSDHSGIYRMARRRLGL